MSCSHNKHELRIPLLQPDDYFPKFWELRGRLYPKGWHMNQLEKLRSELESETLVCSKEFLDIDTLLKLSLLNRYPEKENLLRILQKKFAVFGRIAERYTNTFRKDSEAVDSIEIYAMTAILFCERFQEKATFNDLNSAIKLCDKLVSLIERNDSSQILPLSVTTALGFEQFLLWGLCES